MAVIHKPIPFLGVAFPVYLLSLLFASKEVNWIHSGLRFVTGETDIPKVEHTLCYIVVIKCWLNFTEEIKLG